METFHFFDNPLPLPQHFVAATASRFETNGGFPPILWRLEKMNLNCVNILKWTEAQLK